MKNIFNHLILKCEYYVFCEWQYKLKITATINKKNSSLHQNKYRYYFKNHTFFVLHIIIKNNTNMKMENRKMKKSDRKISAYSFEHSPKFFLYIELYEANVTTLWNETQLIKTKMWSVQNDFGFIKHIWDVWKLVTHLQYFVCFSYMSVETNSLLKLTVLLCCD